VLSGIFIFGNPSTNWNQSFCKAAKVLPVHFGPFAKLRKLRQFISDLLQSRESSASLFQAFRKAAKALPACFKPFAELLLIQRFISETTPVSRLSHMGPLRKA
jgi:hypothetical protein